MKLPLKDGTQFKINIMKKQINVGGDLYEIDYTSENALKVLDALLDWMQHPDHYASSCGEGIMQDDNCQIDAPVLISDIVDDILQPVYIE